MRTADRHLESRPTRRGLARLARAIQPGSRVVAVERLRGGESTPNHAIDLVTPSGERRRFVVRRFGKRNLRADRHIAEHEWDILRFLDGASLPAPRPVLLDAAGKLFGMPALVMTCLPGRGLLTPDDVHTWARQLAHALVRIHHLPIHRMRRGLVPRPQRWVMRWKERDPPSYLTKYPLASTIWSALRPRSEALAAGPDVLVHNDYWPGNTLWSRDRLTGVVDWGTACFGPLGLDVGYCRLDITLELGPEPATTFLRAYESEAGARVENLAAWDLVAATRAVPDGVGWMSGYRQFGRTDLLPRTVASRFGKFVAAALDHLD